MALSSETTREATATSNGLVGGSEAGSSLGLWGVDELDGSLCDGHSQATYPIEQGSQPGLRLFTQCAAATSCLNATMVCAGFPRPNLGVMHSVAMGILPYFVAVCQVFFVLTTWVFEVDLASVRRFSAIDAFQDLLLHQTPWLADIGVRGIVYFVQGVVWLLFVSLEEPHHFVIGMWLIAVAICDFSVHFNLLPRLTFLKTRQVLVDTALHAEEVPTPAPPQIGRKVAGKGNEFQLAELLGTRTAAAQGGVRQAELRMTSDGYQQFCSKEVTMSSDPVCDDIVHELVHVKPSPDSDEKASCIPHTGPPRGAASPRGATSPRGQPPKLNSPSSGQSPPKILPVVQRKEQKACCEVM